MTRLCEQCGRQLDADSLFCPTCALNAGASSAGQPSESSVNGHIPAAEDDERHTAGETGGEGQPRLTPMVYRRIPFQSSRYRIIRQVGQGGMGVVYLAHDLHLDEDVALKILHPHLSADDQALERFKSETRLTRKIAHPNVIRVHDLGDYEGTLYISMEYFPGGDLKELMKSSDFRRHRDWKPLFHQMCGALDAAHSLGIVHRDVKPQNVLVNEEGVIKVGDFGIARWAEATDATTTGLLLGTPSYMSPEQINGRDVDHRSDIYSLGVIVYEIFTGMLPFEDQSPMAVAIKHLQLAPEPPSLRNPGLPPEADRLVLRAMEKNPDNRFPDMQTMLEAFETLELPEEVRIGGRTTVGDGHTVGSGPGSAATVALHMKRGESESGEKKTTEQDAPSSRRVRRRIAFGAAAAVATIVVAMIFVLFVVEADPRSPLSLLRQRIGLKDRSGGTSMMMNRDKDLPKPGDRPLLPKIDGDAGEREAVLEKQLAGFEEDIRAARDSGDVERVYQLRKLFLRLRPDDVSARKEALEYQHAVEGDGHQAEGRLEQARKSYRDGMTSLDRASPLLQERLAGVEFRLARLLMDDGRFDRALGCFEEFERWAALDDVRRQGLDDTLRLCRVESFRNTARTASERGDLETAMAAYASLLQVAPEDENAFRESLEISVRLDTRRAAELVNEGQFAEAMKIFSGLEGRGPLSPETDRLISECRLELLREEARQLEASGEMADAIGRWEEIERLSPTDTEARSRRASLENNVPPEGMVYVGNGESSAKAPGTPPPFFIDKYEVTCRQYQAFIRATGHRSPTGWAADQYPSGKGDHPVIYVNWHDASAYARWAGKRLPTETEWALAACGGDGRSWPWGDHFDDKRANTSESGNGQTTPVGIFSLGVSPYGAHDMSGNVWEWCRTWATKENEKRVVRGGAWNLAGESCGCSARSSFLPGTMSSIIGFRCIKDVIAADR